MARILVFDFDGTVSLGDEPVLGYARQLDALAPEHERGLIERTIAEFLSRDGRIDLDAAETDAAQEALRLVAGSVDGYAAAARLASAQGLEGHEISTAYAASRKQLAGGELATHAPDGLREFLAALPEDARPVLVTNAPEQGVAEQLAALGLADAFAERVTSAGKPAHMKSHLQELLERDGLAGYPQALVSVGDIWLNDLHAAHALGAASALIERFPAPPEARPTVSAATIEELYPWLLAWARGEADAPSRDDVSA